MRRRLLLVLAAGVTAAACGSDSSTSPSRMEPATIRGTVNGGATGSVAFSADPVSGGSSAKAGIKVTVVGTSISTTTDASGQFVLTGITTDRVVLRFQGSGIDATLEIAGLVPGQTLTIKVKVSGNQARLEDDDSTSPSQQKCFSAGQKAEVEGRISQKGASDIAVFQKGQVKGDYLCKVSASTKIRKGNKTFTFDDLKVGDRVHVSGRGAGMNGGACVVDAEEIKLQN
jgi:hypothetical protein